MRRHFLSRPDSAILSVKHTFNYDKERSIFKKTPTPRQKWPLSEAKTRFKTGDCEASFWFRTDSVATSFITTRICDFKCQTNIKTRQGKVDLKKKNADASPKWPLFDTQTPLKTGDSEAPSWFRTDNVSKKTQMRSDKTFQIFTLFNVTNFWMFLRLESDDFDVNFNIKSAW